MILGISIRLIRQFDFQRELEESLARAKAEAEMVRAVVERVNGYTRLRCLVPCAECRHLRTDLTAVYTVRCAKGETSDQCSDFSCFEAKR